MDEDPLTLKQLDYLRSEQYLIEEIVGYYNKYVENLLLPTLKLKFAKGKFFALLPNDYHGTDPCNFNDSLSGTTFFEGSIYKQSHKSLQKVLFTNSTRRANADFIYLKEAYLNLHEMRILNINDKKLQKQNLLTLDCNIFGRFCIDAVKEDKFSEILKYFYHEFGTFLSISSDKNALSIVQIINSSSLLAVPAYDGESYIIWTSLNLI